MRTFTEWKNLEGMKTITITCRDGDDTLEKLLHHIKALGNTGHTFSIVVDDHNKFEWDGDGSDTIRDIKVVKS